MSPEKSDYFILVSVKLESTRFRPVVESIALGHYGVHVFFHDSRIIGHQQI